MISCVKCHQIRGMMADRCHVDGDKHQFADEHEPDEPVSQDPAIHEQLRKAIATNPVVHMCAARFKAGQCAWDEAMEIMVIALIKQNNALLAQHIDYLAHGPSPIIIIKDPAAETTTTLVPREPEENVFIRKAAQSKRT